MSDAPAIGKRSPRRRRGLCAFTANAEATTALEFTLLAPLFFVIMLEIMQVGLYFYTSATLDYAMNLSARPILTGSVQNQNLSQSQYVSQVVCPVMPPSFNGSDCPSNVIVQITNQPISTGLAAMINATGDDIVKPAPMGTQQATFCLGFSGGVNPNNGVKGVEVVQIFYPMPVVSLILTAYVSSLNNPNGLFYLSSVATFQNEPYQVTTQNIAQGC